MFKCDDGNVVDVWPVLWAWLEETFYGWRN